MIAGGAAEGLGAGYGNLVTWGVVSGVRWIGGIWELHGCGSLGTVEIYTWVCNKDIGKIKGSLDSLFGKYNGKGVKC